MYSIVFYQVGKLIHEVRSAYLDPVRPCTRHELPNWGYTTNAKDRTISKWYGPRIEIQTKESVILHAVAAFLDYKLL